MADLPYPIKKHFFGNKLSLDKLKIAGASFLAVKSPEAPKIIIIVGGVFLFNEVLESVVEVFIILRYIFNARTRGRWQYFHDEKLSHFYCLTWVNQFLPRQTGKKGDNPAFL